MQAAFESLLEGVEDAHRHALDKPLRVQTFVTASILAMARRVPQFLQDNPQVKLVLSTCAVDWEFDDVHADVGLVYCETPPSNKYHWVPLFDYTLFPVCSPQMAASMGPTPTAAHLLTKPMIAINTEFRNCHTWFGSAGVKFYPTSTSLVVDTLQLCP